MKKNMLMISGGIALLLLVGCGTTKPTQTQTTTGAVMSGQTVVSGQILSVSGQVIPPQDNGAREEVSGSNQTGTVASRAENNNPIDPTTASGSKLPAEISGLLDERAKQPIATGKLTEDDITLMEKIIEKVQTLSK